MERLLSRALRWWEAIFFYMRIASFSFGQLDAEFSLHTAAGLAYQATPPPMRWRSDAMCLHRVA